MMLALLFNWAMVPGTTAPPAAAALVCEGRPK